MLGSLLLLLADREKDTSLPSSSEEPLRWASEEPSQRPASPLRGLLVSEVAGQQPGVTLSELLSSSPFALWPLLPRASPPRSYPHGELPAGTDNGL